MILVLSVFNGFEELIVDLFSNFNPDVKITAIEGKTFKSNPDQIAELRKLSGVQYVSETLEEIAFFEHSGNQDFGILKGVDSFYHKINSIDSTIREGRYKLFAGDQNLAVLGAGMRNKLAIDIHAQFSSINVYMPKNKSSAIGQPFKKKILYPSGTFAIQQDFDNQYVLSSLDFTQNILSVKNQVSAYEIRLHKDINASKTIAGIQSIMGDRFLVRNRYQQDEAFLKLMNIEKWMSFAILSLIIVLILFNMVGALWMIVLEKRKDIAILKSMGAQNGSIGFIFLAKGLMLCLLGLLVGFTAAVLLYLSQKWFSIVSIPEGFVVNAYPISMRLMDFIAVTVMVLSIGFLASLPAALRATKIKTMVRV